MIIQRNQPAHQQDFIRLNELWIEEYFTLEEADRVLRKNPWAIVDGGGHIFSATAGEDVIGVGALFRVGKDELQLARMAVEPAHRGRGIGRALAESALRQAKEDGIRRVFLYTNTCLQPAISLYRSLGFTIVSEGCQAAYTRCNVLMEIVIS